MHTRREPSKNTFRYGVSYFLLDLDELPQIERRLALVSRNRRNVVSFRDRDYLDGDGTPLKEAVVRFCAERGAHRRARAHPHPAPRARLCLQPRDVPLVLRP